MRRKNAAVLMTAVIIGGLLTSCGSAYNNTNGKNSDNTVETQTTVRTVVMEKPKLMVIMLRQMIKKQRISHRK